MLYFVIFSKFFPLLISLGLSEGSGHCPRQNSILHEKQYAFREGFSTDLALLDFNDYVKKEIDKGNFILTLFIDLKKAFDTVDHLILLKKLEHYGIRGHSNLFFESYLSNRKQYVHCNDVDSSVMNILCGVPQGSVLGPTLFLMYVNDMINKYSTLYEKGCISGLKYHGFPNKLLQYVLFVVFEVHLPLNTFEKKYIRNSN